MQVTLEDLYCGRAVRLGWAGQQQSGETITVHVERGMLDRQRLKVADGGTGRPGVTVRLAQRPHDRFERHRDDLLIRQRVPLLHCLTGTISFELDHLDGRRLQIAGPKETVVQSGTVLAVPNEGMPTRDDPWVRGRLIIEIVAV